MEEEVLVYVRPLWKDVQFHEHVFFVESTRDPSKTGLNLCNFMKPACNKCQKFSRLILLMVQKSHSQPPFGWC